MARGRKRKTNKGIFTEEQMQSAVNLVVTEKLSLRLAAEKTGVEFQTLYRYAKKKKLAEDDTKIRFTPNYACRQIFNQEQEATIAEYAIKCAKMCYGKSRKDLRSLAYEVAAANHLNIPESWKNNKEAGIEWLHGFMSRNKHLSVREPEGSSLSRATSFNKHNVDLFFANLESIFSRSGNFSNGTRIFNLDETATTTVQKPRKIVAKKGIKQVSSATSGERGILVTTCCIVSASGSFIPPAMVFPRKKFKAHMLHGAPPGTLGLAQPSGWMNVELFADVMKHFIFHTSSSANNPTLLIMDNHESHLSAYVLDLAKKNGVIILTLPPHCSNKLQPLDLSVFYPFKAFYNAAIESWLLRNPGRPITIYEIAECVGVAFEKSMTPQNITAGFKKSGIFPFDKHVFSEDDYLMSSVTDRIKTDDQIAGPSNRNDNTEPNSDGIDQMGQLHETKNHDENMSVPITKRNEENAFISPEVLKGYPQAPELKQKNRSRKRKSIIATDTPELNAIEQKSKEKQRQKELKIRKKTVKVRLFESSSDESDYEEQSGGSSEDVSDIEDSIDKDHFPELDRPPTVNDYVLVQFDKLKTVVHYVGKILGKNGDDFEITFLRKSVKSPNCFVYPTEEDVSLVHERDIKLILSKHSTSGKTKRQQSLIRFEVNLSSLNVR